MPKFTINAGFDNAKTIEADHYKTDAEWVRFYAVASDGNMRECASYPKASVVNVEQEGTVT